MWRSTALIRLHACVSTQLIILERDIIDNSVVLGVTQLRQIVESSNFVGRASAIAAKTNGSDPLSTVDGIVGMSNATLDIVTRLRPNVDWIKSKANKVTFGIIQEYATTFGFYRSEFGSRDRLI